MMGPITLACALLLGSPPAASDEDPRQPAVTIENRTDGLAISVGGKPFVQYAFEDGPTTRPFFKNLRTPAGMSITRNHPPNPEGDPVDHATMHPGLWMAFGDVGGADFWRNKDRVRHVGLVDRPIEGPGRGEFVVRNRYEKGGETIGEEVARYTILPRDEGTLLLWDSTFTSRGAGFVFGDQEEMGLGIRMATPLTVKHGDGGILNSDGFRNERQIWGKPAAWCAYDGPTGDGPDRAGIVLMTHPDNFRPSWFHARDYGLLVANPFGRNAFTKGEKSAITVEPGRTIRLRFGVFVFQGKPDFKAVYADYLDAAGE